MAVESDSDRAVFFDTDEFGVAATYQRAGQPDTSINGIFDDAYMAIGGLGRIDVSSSGPVLHCQSSDLPTGMTQGVDTLVVSGVTYTVVEIMPDGTGVTDLRLAE